MTVLTVLTLPRGISITVPYVLRSIGIRMRCLSLVGCRMLISISVLLLSHRDQISY